MEDFKVVKDEKVFKDLKEKGSKLMAHISIRFIHSKILDNRKRFPQGSSFFSGF